MAEFNRKELKRIFEDASIEVPKDVLGQICDLHITSLDGLNDSVKELRQKLETAEQERDAFKAKAPKDGEETVAKSEYDALKKQYEDYKNEQTAKETNAAKEKAVRALYKEIGISEKRIDSVLKVTALDSISLDKDGKIKEADTLKETAKTEWADFIETTSPKGATTATPPTNNGTGTGKTRDEIMAIKDGSLRRAEMQKNSHLFSELNTTNV